MTRQTRIKVVTMAVLVVFTSLIGLVTPLVIASATNHQPSLYQSAQQTPFTVDTKLIADGFSMPVYITHAGSDAQRLFVVEKGGVVKIIQAGKVLPTPFLDIQRIVGSQGYEQGLLSIAFHPHYTDNGYFYVYYTDRNGDTAVARYSVSASNPNVADPQSAKMLLQVNQPYPNHNGGLVLFGPDGYLYIGLGDGGSGGDPLGSGQDTQSLLGKILRIDVDNGDPYAIPKNNPFADGKRGKPEVWTYGWRNPWRFSFDHQTGDMYIADVGQNTYEEVSFQPAGQGGLNYGWNVMEAFHCFQPRQGCQQTGLQLPLVEYSHEFGISITGGYVYRGTQFPALQGYYFFADFGSTRLWTFKTGTSPVQAVELGTLGISVSSFGEDANGELYITDLGGGGVYQLVVP